MILCPIESNDFCFTQYYCHIYSQKYFNYRLADNYCSRKEKHVEMAY